MNRKEVPTSLSGEKEGGTHKGGLERRKEVPSGMSGEVTSCLSGEQDGSINRSDW